MKRITPNFITSLRPFLFGPLVCLFLALACQFGILVQCCLWLALLSMGFGETTDGLDGYVARKTGQVTDFGKIYDPMADSLYRLMIWTTLLSIGWVPLWAMLIFLVRDIVVANIRIILAIHKVVMGARKSGKVKAIFQGAAQGILVVSHTSVAANLFNNPQLVAKLQFVAILLAAVVTLFSLYDYCRGFCQITKENKIVFT